jgi:hypothetical protein
MYPLSSEAEETICYRFFVPSAIELMHVLLGERALMQTGIELCTDSSQLTTADPMATMFRFSSLYIN